MAASWPTDPSEVARWVAALTSPSTPGVAGGGSGGGRPERGGGAARSTVAAGVANPPEPHEKHQSGASPPCSPPPPPGRLVATVDLECPYLRDLVLSALARRPAWTTIRADPIVTTLDPDDVPSKPAKPSDDANTTTSEEEEEGGGGTSTTRPPLTLLTPHPAASTSSFHWGEYERIDWARVHASDQAASAYCVRKGLTRKAHLAFNLKKWAAKHGAASPAAAALAAATPETHILQVDDPDYVEEALADLPEVRDAAAPGGGAGSGNAWIVKPSLANRGAGIAIIDSAPALTSALAAARGASEWVVQRYVTNPHLLGGRKWHLRVYALAAGALEVWVYRGVLVLRARAPYRVATAEGGGGGMVVAPLADLDAHLTNTCRAGGGGGGGGGKEASKKAGGNGGGLFGAARRLVGGLLGRRRHHHQPSSSPAVDPVVDPVDSGLALSLSDLPAALVSENGMEPAAAAAAVASLTSSVASLVGETFAAVSAELSFFPLPSAWELFGFDFMVDENWNVFLLEANADPDVGASGEKLKSVIAGLVEGVLARTADRVAAAAGAGVEHPAILVPGTWEEEGGSSASPGWTRVFVRDGGRGGASGMRVA